MSISPINTPAVEPTPTVQQTPTPPTPVVAQAAPATDPTVSSGSLPATPAAQDTSAVSSSAPVSGSGTTVSSADASKIANTLQNSAAFRATGLSFSTDKQSGLTVIRVTDTETNEVIRQIPTQEALAMTHTIDSDLRGNLVNQKA
jgi:flagellar protein FlaG